MKKFELFLLSTTVISVIILSFFLFFPLNLIENKENWNETDIPEVKNISIKTVYDNYQSSSELDTGWGFSCLIQNKNKNILFDTGESAKGLLKNMEKMDINPKSINIVFLSHRHWDHVGGLKGFLKENSDVDVYILKSFPKTIKNKINRLGASFSEVKNFKKITDEVSSTGPLKGPPEEQSMIISTDKGLVLITGCAHPGITKIVERAKKLTGKNVYLVMGGFHLGSASDREIKRIIDSFKEMGVKKVAPSHCSGDRARELFKREYGKNYIENGAGKVIKI